MQPSEITWFNLRQALKRVFEIEQCISPHFDPSDSSLDPPYLRWSAKDPLTEPEQRIIVRMEEAVDGFKGNVKWNMHQFADRAWFIEPSSVTEFIRSVIKSVEGGEPPSSTERPSHFHVTLAAVEEFKTRFPEFARHAYEDVSDLQKTLESVMLDPNTKGEDSS